MTGRGEWGRGGTGVAPDRLRDLAAELHRHPFEAPFWLRGAHRQTFWSPLFRPRPDLPWRPEWLQTPDDDRLLVHHLDGRPDRPTLLLLHGLEGSIRSNYVGGTAARLFAHGWSVVALEFRSCSGELNLAPRLYHSGETTDLAFVAGELARRLRQGPDRVGGGTQLYAAGVSLGGNVLAKWLGEDPAAVPEEVAGAAAVSVPFDLEVSGPSIDRALGGFYTWRFLRTLRPKAVRKAGQYPDLLDAEELRRSRTFEHFDTHATARLHGFEDAWDYWRRCGCGQFLPDVRRPLLLIAAEDDPFNPAHAIPKELVEEQPWLVGVFPRTGGHVGFVQGWPWGTRHWAEEQMERWFLGLAGG